MNKQILGLCALLIVWFVAPVRAAESDKPAPSAYRQLMQAQYAAKAAPMPARPDEAQRIYNAYLRTIGQPVNGRNPDSGTTAGMPSH
jgi:hypothetical protein